MSSSPIPKIASTFAFASALVLLGLALDACVANQASAPARAVVVNGPPPPPIAEERPPAPGPQAAWVAGYWHWTGMHYAWIPGHWESAPPGQTWSAPQYTTRDGT